MLSILINAYACSPNMGSEPGMAWNWCVNLANHCELHIITEGEFRDKIEAVLPALPQGKNMHFYYNPVSEEIRKMCWNQGDWRFYKYYREWQWKTYEMAKDICQHTHIDILHQLNMIGFREPGYLWKIPNIPFVWGPIDAKEKFPVAYLEGTGLKAKMFIRLKNFLTGIQLHYSKRVHQAAKRASVIISASSNSQQSLKKYFHIDSPLLNETGCYVQEHPITNKAQKETFDVLWVGKMDFRKQLGLAIQSVAKMANPSIILHIVGSGNNEPYQTLAKELNIDKQCKWHGAVTHDEVQHIMQESDLFLFTSVAEGTPHVVLEAIGNNLPVLCFNTCGQGDSVTEKVGYKIELSDPQHSINDFAAALNRFEKNRNLLKECSLNCKARQQELSWENKAKQMVELYQKTIEQYDQKNNSKITTILIYLSFILVVFSFIAPVIFTRDSIFPEIDFTNKGEIGDTIGGIMNPFIAIAGVITTFLAFLMQVRANSIQREQFLASLQNENRKEEMDSFYNLQILKLDLDNIINNITSNINSLDEFIQETRQNPYAMCRLNRTSLKHYDRIRQIPRKMVFRGFQLYISPINKEWTKKFNQLYNAIDFASDGFENIYAIEKHHQDECFSIKIQIKEELIEVERKGEIILSSMDNFPNKDFKHNVSLLLTEYEEELKNSNDERKEGNFLRIKEILTKFIWSVQYNTGVKNCYDTEYKYIEKVTNIIKKLNDIEQGTSQLIPNLELFKNNMYDKTDSCVNKIKEINNLIDQAIQKTNKHSL